MKSSSNKSSEFLTDRLCQYENYQMADGLQTFIPLIAAVAKTASACVKSSQQKAKRWRLKITLWKGRRCSSLGAGKETRRLSDLVNLWYERHGITLSDGKKRQSVMLWAADCMGSPLANEFTPQLFTTYRAQHWMDDCRVRLALRPSHPAPSIWSRRIFWRSSMS